MIVDGRSSALPGGDYDVLIVGAGPAGITLAQELAGAPLRTLLVESGGFDFDPETQALYEGPVTGHEVTDLTAARLRFFGGTSNHWGGHCLPLDPIDFERAPLSGLTGWPFGRETLDPFYNRAHNYCDLGRFDYEVDLDEDRRLVFDDRLQDALIRQSSPTRFGEKYRGALATADGITVLMWSNVTNLAFDEAGRVTGVTTHTLSGPERTFRASIVVLAGGAVENARLLLAMNERNGRSFGDAGGFLGACYMDHAVGGAGFLYLDQPVGKKAYWSHDGDNGTPVHYVLRLSEDTLRRENLANTQFFPIPFSEDEAVRALEREAGRSFHSLKKVAKWALGRTGHSFSLSDEYCRFINNADSFALHQWAKLSGSVGEVGRVLLRYETELQPTRASYVALDDTTDVLGLPRSRLNWSPTLDDRESLVRSIEVIGAAAGATGLGRVELESHFDQRYFNASTAWHAMGTTRISVGESDGVVDPDCRVHGTRGLYVAGSSVFPSGGRANPTLTIVAISIRLADHIKKTMEA